MEFRAFAGSCLLIAGLLGAGPFRFSQLCCALHSAPNTL
jgi:hypothetical protein